MLVLVVAVLSRYTEYRVPRVSYIFTWSHLTDPSDFSVAAVDVSKVLVPADMLTRCVKDGQLR